jgi:hypothetical protein
MPASDFLVNGVPYAKVLYVEGNVWIRSPDDKTFHLLTADQPVALHSVIYTGVNGTLDLATGPGMAVRMVPLTLIRVAELPDASSLSNSTTAPVESTRLGLKNGTLFSALGRSNGQPVDFEVRTPLGTAAAKGTMFATSVTSDNAEVNMLHGTVNFETPDHQTSQITAGQGQKISGTAGGAFHLNQPKTLNASNSPEFFNNAGGLLEHASGSGVVRRSLGPDVVKGLQKQGYKLPTATQERFQNSAKASYPNHHAINGANKSNASESNASGTGGGAKTSTTARTSPATEPSNHQAITPNERSHPTPEKNSTSRRERGLNGKNKNWGQ